MAWVSLAQAETKSRARQRMPSLMAIHSSRIVKKPNLRIFNQLCRQSVRNCQISFGNRNFLDLHPACVRIEAVDGGYSGCRFRPEVFFVDHAVLIDDEGPEYRLPLIHTSVIAVMHGLEMSTEPRGDSLRYQECCPDPTN